jgi:DNA mismatch repair protein MutL
MTEININEVQTIKLLPEHLVDQIKAGEVVERPSSLIKELLENSIDAHASKIDIQIIDNGLELISVEDNGKGINFKDLPYAFCRHATSKIERYEDLYKLYSYGFRGEALASIASSSKLVCQSAPTELTSGGRIEIDGGRQSSLCRLTGNKSGTSIYIKELFYNTPARLKFIKSKQSEKSSLNRIINAFLIANPSISFSIKWDDKDKVIHKGLEVVKLDTRLSKIFFNNKKDAKPLHYFSTEYEGNKIWGYLSQESSRGNAGKSHFLFANNRLFNDRGLHQTVLRNSKELWGEGNTGNYAIFISTPPSEIDVNVHPNKIQIKFFKSTMIFSLLSSILSKSISKEIEADHIKPEFSTSQFTSSSFHYPHTDNEYPRKRDAQNFIDKTSTQLFNGFMISNNFSLLEIAEEKCLVDNYKLYQFFWDHLQLNEALITPLIISEPFYLKNSFNDYYQFFETKGLEFNRINDELVLLKTIPEAINGFSYSTFILPLIFFQLEKNAQTLYDDITSKKAKCFQSISEVFNILNLYSVDKLKDQKIIIHFKESLIQDLFSQQ